MTTSDLVSRLLEAIGETERIAQETADLAGPDWRSDPCDSNQCEGHISSDREGELIACQPFEGGGMYTQVGPHIAHNDPSSVLRRCAAERKLIERDGPFCDCGARRPPTNPDTGQPIPHHYDCSAYEAAQILAEAYGLEVTE